MPSCLRVLNMILRGSNRFRNFADVNFVVCFSAFIKGSIRLNRVNTIELKLTSQ